MVVLLCFGVRGAAHPHRRQAEELGCRAVHSTQSLPSPALQQGAKTIHTHVLLDRKESPYTNTLGHVPMHCGVSGQPSKAHAICESTHHSLTPWYREMSDTIGYHLEHMTASSVLPHVKSQWPELVVRHTKARERVVDEVGQHHENTVPGGCAEAARQHRTGRPANKAAAVHT